MKKIMLLLIALMSMQTAIVHADDATANIKIKVAGALHDNRYFLCLPNAGCFSILNGEKGRVVNILHAIDMDGIYLEDVNNNFRIYAQNAPASCNAPVQTNQTLTISGTIAKSGDQLRIAQLRCSVK